jgi:hypothetical protein
MTLCAFALVPWFPLALRLTALAIPIITFTRLPSMLMLLALLPAVAVGPAFVAGLVGTWATGKLDAIVEELWMNRLGAIAFYLSATAPELDLVDFWSQPLDSTLGRIALVATRLVGIDLAWPVFVIGLVLFLLPARQLGWRWAAYALLLFVLEDSARNFSVVLLPLVLCTLRPESST